MPERIDSPGHPAFRAAAELSTALGRAAAGRYLVEGVRLVRQALTSPTDLHAALIVQEAEADDLPDELARAGVATYLLPARLVPRLIGTGYETRVGALGIVSRRPLPSFPAEGLLLVGEGIQDPRNVGVLVRTAEAAGVAAAAFSDDGADPYSRPAVRSSTGSILRQPVHLAADIPALFRSLQAQGVRLVATSAHAERNCWEEDLRGAVAILVGNESTGLSEAAMTVADAVVGLPIAGGASSLNVTVAAGAVLYEAIRQRRVGP